MKKRRIILLFFLSVLVLSYTSKSQMETFSLKTTNQEPIVNLKDLQTDFGKWWTYYYYNISLSSDFVGLNEQSDTIAKRPFLEKLITSNYIPLKLKSKARFDTYQLFELDSSANPGIRSTIQNESRTSLNHFEMEGLTFPEFDFTDLNGNHYTKENTAGKTVILKTWFIGCTACIAEFPALNDLVNKFKKREDIIFLSLADDPPSKLESFLKKRRFEYKVVADQKDFIKNDLKLRIYPTHIIVDDKGVILKVVNHASEMIAFLEGE